MNIDSMMIKVPRVTIDDFLKIMIEVDEKNTNTLLEAIFGVFSNYGSLLAVLIDSVKDKEIEYIQEMITLSIFATFDGFLANNDNPILREKILSLLKESDRALYESVHCRNKH